MPSLPSLNSFNNTQLAVLAALAALFLLMLVGLVRAAVIRRHTRLRRRFGPEYDRAVEEYGDEREAERALRARERHVKHLHLHPLRERDRTEFAQEWTRIQALFIDEPSRAVTAADRLIKAVMEARGYEPEPFEDRVADLSVEHANVVQHYRAARALAAANRESRADTEELRQALVHYRELFSALLEKPAEVVQNLKEARV
jgi:hypothetical protein